MSTRAAAKLRQQQFDLELEELRKARREPPRGALTFVVHWNGMLRGAGTSKVGREYRSKEGFELFVPGDLLIAKEFDVAISPRKSKRERVRERKLTVTKDFLEDVCRAGWTDDDVKRFVHDLEAIDTEEK